MPRLPRALLLLLAFVLAATGCGGCSGGGGPGGSATARLKRHFGLEKAGTPGEIREGLLRKVPAGTPEQAVIAFLGNSGIGKDGLSSWYPADEQNEIFCRIELDPASFGLVKESYGIGFRLDGNRNLLDIQIHKWSTGL
ncbi:MAG: hypothetical protein L6R43_08740 [Planctomycetes bacterium]|nr:hypothetical protein [Planctomycetota bacterium]